MKMNEGLCELFPTLDELEVAKKARLMALGDIEEKVEQHLFVSATLISYNYTSAVPMSFVSCSFSSTC